MNCCREERLDMDDKTIRLSDEGENGRPSETVFEQPMGGYQAGLSMLRIVATASVVWLHTCSTLVQNPDVFIMTERQFRFFSAGYEMMYWAVPVFFMITGALLLNPNKKIGAKDCWKKYVCRAMLALVIFGIPFAILKLVMESGTGGLSVVPLSVKVIAENGSLAHLWYLYMLIGIYLILPILRAFVKTAEDSEIKLVLSALLILDFVIPLFNCLKGWNVAFSLPLQYPVFYCLMGYYLIENHEKFAVHKWVITGIIIVCVVAIWILSYTTDLAGKWTAYNSPLTAGFSIAVFSLFMNWNGAVTKKMWNIDRLCFGVYLIHPVFIQFVYRFLKITPVGVLVYPISTVLFAVAFLSCSFIGSWVLSLIKPLKKYVL